MNEPVHIVGRFQGLLERLGFEPRTLCGASLAADGPDGSWLPRPTCRACAGRARWAPCGCGDFHPKRAARHCAAGADPDAGQN